MSVIAFDVDGCLIDERDQPRHEVIDLLRALHRLGFDIIVWSGGGADYAARWAERLGLGPYITTAIAKDPKARPTLAVDDQPGADLGLVYTLVLPSLSD